MCKITKTLCTCRSFVVNSWNAVFETLNSISSSPATHHVFLAETSTRQSPLFWHCALHQDCAIEAAIHTNDVKVFIKFEDMSLALSKMHGKISIPVLAAAQLSACVNGPLGSHEVASVYVEARLLHAMLISMSGVIKRPKATMRHCHGTAVMQPFKRGWFCSNWKETTALFLPDDLSHHTKNLWCTWHIFSETLSIVCHVSVKYYDKRTSRGHLLLLEAGQCKIWVDHYNSKDTHVWTCPQGFAKLGSFAVEVVSDAAFMSKDLLPAMWARQDCTSQFHWAKSMLQRHTHNDQAHLLMSNVFVATDANATLQKRASTTWALLVAWQSDSLMKVASYVWLDPHFNTTLNTSCMNLTTSKQCQRRSLWVLQSKLCVPYIFLPVS